MRENIANPTPMETLSFNSLQSPYDNPSSGQKSILISVSSNVYYGYQPLRVVNNTGSPESAEPMATDDFKNSGGEMDTNPNPCEARLNRKRTRGSTDSSVHVWKKRRQNEPLRSVSAGSQRCRPTEMYLEEDLLRETHGCSYYHWISSGL